MEVNKIYNMDCIEGMKMIPNKSIDCIITDPPYGTTACKWDNVIPFDLMWEQLNRIIKDNGAIVLFGSEPFSSMLRCSNLKMFKYDWYWNKGQGTGFLNSKKMPLKSIECISVFQKSINYNPQMRKGFKSYEIKKGGLTDNYSKDSCENIITKSDGDRFPLTLIKFNRDKSKNHPTQKPVALIEYLIKTYTNENETVLDFTMGSGTTAVACINTNRNFIGFELEEKYFDVANKRISEAYTEKANLLF